MKQIKLRCIHCGDFVFYEGNTAYDYYKRRINSLLFPLPCLICDEEMIVVRGEYEDNYRNDSTINL
jgi:hypothetical protein